MEIRNIVLELGVDKYGEPLFCSEAKNEVVEVESSWYSYSALSYADSYVNKHADATTVLHVAYDDSRGMVLHMKVKDRDNVSTVVYDSKAAVKKLFMSEGAPDNVEIPVEIIADNELYNYVLKFACESDGVIYSNVNMML